MIKKYFSLMVDLFKFKISKQLMYRFDFWSVLFADGFLFIVQILTFSAIFTQVDDINGWSVNQVIVFIGTFTIVDGAAMGSFFFGIWSLPEKIRTGKLDFYIIKPVNTLFLVSFDSFNPSSFLVSLSGVVITTYGLANLDVEITITKILGYLFLLLLMYSLMYSLALLVRVISFWVVKIDSLSELENQVVEFAYRVPGVVYEGFAKVLLMIIIPYGMIATIPTQFVTDVLSMEYWLMAVGVSVTFFALSVLMFRLGLKRYDSASS